MRYEAKLTSKGQLTLPAALRESLNLKPGDKVVFIENAKGHVEIEARTKTLADLRGVVRLRGRAPIDDWIAEARAARADQALSGARKSKADEPKADK
jgi:AbrB family looped-hinge helix DNA binding protein